MKISVIGTGYVGLVTGTCFAETGIQVSCIDVDKNKIDQLNKGIIPIYEPGLDDMVKRNCEKKRLFFTTSLENNIADCSAAFIAVGTPPDEDGSADLQYVLAVARQIGQLMQDYLVVVTKSTVPIGTSEKVRKAVQNELNKRGVDIPFDIASNPEFLKEGSAVDDFLKPDRIIVGIDTERAEKLMRKLYKPFVLNNHPILFMDIPSAELTKYASNAMLATKISFINDVANLCEMVGADINAVRKGIGSDPRIGHKFIYAGAGYGGSCFPKDVKALIHTAKKMGHPMQILEAVEAVNDRQKTVIFNKINSYFKQQLTGKKIALWGLSFKPHTDDMREAPSLVLIDLLLKAGASVTAYDPVAMPETKRLLGNAIHYVNEQYEATKDADALVLITEWPEFRMPDHQLLKKNLKNHLVFDGRNIFDPIELQELGYTYFGIGR